MLPYLSFILIMTTNIPTKILLFWLYPKFFAFIK